MDTQTIFGLLLCGLLIVVPIIVLVRKITTKPILFPLEKNGPERLRISGKSVYGFWLDGKSVSQCTVEQATTGHSIHLDDGSTLNVRLDIQQLGNPKNFRNNWLIFHVVDKSMYEWNDNICWFCEKRESNRSAATLIKMCKEPHEMVNILVPRCLVCESNHNSIINIQSKVRFRLVFSITAVICFFTSFGFLITGSAIGWFFLVGFLAFLFTGAILLVGQARTSSKSIQRFVTSHDSKLVSTTSPKVWKLIGDGWRPITEATELELGCIQSITSETYGNTRYTTHKYVPTPFFFINRKMTLICRNCQRLVIINGIDFDRIDSGNPIRGDPGNDTKMGHGIYHPNFGISQPNFSSFRKE